MHVECSADVRDGRTICREAGEDGRQALDFSCQETFNDQRVSQSHEDAPWSVSHERRDLEGVGASSTSRWIHLRIASMAWAMLLQSVRSSWIAPAQAYGQMRREACPTLRA